jgi:hypothetical protein
VNSVKSCEARKGVDLKQVFIGIALVLLVSGFGNYLNNTSSKLSLYLITGTLFGYILTRSRFGFAGGIKRVYITGDGSLTRALLIMFGITIIATAGIHWHAVSSGADVIPGISGVKALDFGTIVGGFLFGIGMMLAGGCASGTLTDLGEGAVRALIVLPFFCVGAVMGHGSRYIFDQSSLSNISTKIYLPNIFGYVGAVLVSFLFLIILYTITRKYESFRKKEGFYDDEAFEEFEKPLAQEENFKLFSYNTYHRIFVERWSFLVGSLFLAMIFIFTINTTGKSWGVTSAFTTWGVALLKTFGISLSSPAFESVVKTVDKGLLNDPGSVRNIGTILGASIAFLLAGRFKIDKDFNLKDMALYILGGLLMGFGARFAKGCNIGALYAAISNFSIHGWGFLVALSLGGIVGLKAFEGKINIIPENRYKRKK